MGSADAISKETKSCILRDRGIVEKLNINIINILKLTKYDIWE